jgi:hypothetical protein
MSGSAGVPGAHLSPASFTGRDSALRCPRRVQRCNGKRVDAHVNSSSARFTRAGTPQRRLSQNLLILLLAHAPRGTSGARIEERGISNKNAIKTPPLPGPLPQLRWRRGRKIGCWNSIATISARRPYLWRMDQEVPALPAFTKFGCLRFSARLSSKACSPRC